VNSTIREKPQVIIIVIMSDTISTTGGTEATSAADGRNSAGKCPVDHKNRSLWGVLGIGSDSDSSSTKQQQNSVTTTTTTTTINDKNIPASLEEAAMYAQTPQPNQRLPLSTHRLESSIPSRSINANSNPPAHQIKIPKLNENDENSGSNDTDNNKWVYPSEQQVFNAMKRKGWKGIEEESIPSFLQIHNSVNERSWKEVRKWEEQVYANTNNHSTVSGGNGNGNNIELVRFEGRPKDLSPKAWFLSTFLSQDKPFDRHDWYISNNKQEEKRYILDFYMEGNSFVDIDVRPALDTPEAFGQRGIQLLRGMLPGISREIDERFSKE